MKNKLLLAAKITLTLSLFLTAGCASFILESDPDKAAIYHGSHKLGETPLLLNLFARERTFVLRKNGYVDKTIKISPYDENVNQHFKMQPVLFTRIKTNPQGAHIINLTDNKNLGKTPKIVLISSAKKIKIEKDGYKTIETELTPNASHQFDLIPTSGFKPVLDKQISFTSEQGDVKIYDLFEGMTIGTTPVSLDLEVGDKLEYRLKGYKTIKQTITKLTPKNIHIGLKPMPYITLIGPEGATVHLPGNNTAINTLPYTFEATGDRLLEIHKKGYITKLIGIEADTSKEIEVKLEPIPSKELDSTPSGADIYRLGGYEKLGTTPYSFIADTEHTFEIRKKGYNNAVVGMGPTSPTTINVELTQKTNPEQDAAAIGSLKNGSISIY